MSVTRIPGGFVDEELDDEQRVIVELLTRAYWMEIETVMNYIAASISHNGRARAVTTALREGVEEEVGHARPLGRRIQERHLRRFEGYLREFVESADADSIA